MEPGSTTSACETGGDGQVLFWVLFVCSLTFPAGETCSSRMFLSLFPEQTKETVELNRCRRLCLLSGVLAQIFGDAETAEAVFSLNKISLFGGDLMK